MRTPFAFIPAMTFLVAGCSPQEQVRTPDFYLKPENAAEYAKALATCRTSGMGNKEKCGPVWLAKFAFDRAEEQALIERALAERANGDPREGGVSVVPQTPRPAPASIPAPARKAPEQKSAEAVSPGATPPSKN